MKYEIKFENRMIPGIVQRGIFLFLLLLAGAGISLAQDPFYLAHRNHQDMILQVANNSQSNGTPIVLGVRNDGKTALHAQQAWYYDNATQTIRLKANPNKCIARKGQLELGDPIVLADVSAGSALQQWVIEGNRIKLASNKLLGITLGSQSYNANTPATLGEVTSLGTYDNWYVRQIPGSLVADGKSHLINSPGDTYIDMCIPDPCPYTYLSFRVRGADGGHRTVSGTTKSKGGEGALISATFKIGTGANEIKPGSNLRFIIGRHGEIITNAWNMSSGAGGGTGVILETPGTANDYKPWTLLMIAAGGAGAYSDCCAYHKDGYPGKVPSEGIGSGDNYNDAIKEQDGMYWPVGNTYLSDDGQAHGAYGCSGGWPRVKDFIVSGSMDEALTSPGGYSIGGTSNINGSYCLTPYLEVKNGVTSSPVDGHVEYIFGNEGPVYCSRYFQADKGTEVRVLETSGWVLLWQYDGNLVLYQTGVAKWASNTQNKGLALRFQGDGNLVIYQNGVAVWASNTADNQHNGKGGRKMYLTPFGELFMLNQDNQIVWRGH